MVPRSCNPCVIQNFITTTPHKLIRAPQNHQVASPTVSSSFPRDSSSMVFLKLPLSDPDVIQSSSASATPASYFRIEDNFSEDMTISAVFLESCKTTFLHLPNSVNRGLEMTTFAGRDMDSGEVISVSVTDSTVRWVEILREFSSLFHVTFKLHTKFIYSTPIGSSVAVPCNSLFDSLTDRRTARLAREDDERGQFSPLNRLKWCSLWTVRTFIEIQWRAVIDLFFIPNKVRFKTYVFQVKAVCWMTTAKVEMEAGRNPNIFPGDIHPTCPFGCLKPYQPLSEFALTTFLPCPDKDISNKGADAPFLSYQCAKARIIQGKKNAGDTFVPSLTIAEVKSKWAVPPINTRGDYFFIIVKFYLSLFQALFLFFMHFIFFHAQFITVTLYVSLI